MKPLATDTSKLEPKVHCQGVLQFCNGTSTSNFLEAPEHNHKERVGIGF